MDLLFLLAMILLFLNLPWQGWKSIVSALIVAAVLLPSLHLLDLTYGLLSFISVTTIALLLNRVMDQHLEIQLLSDKQLRWLASSVFVFGSMLYLDLSNVWQFSIYSLGFSASFSIVLLALIGFSVLLRQSKFIYLLLLVWLAWLLGLNASDNGFDYLLDVPVYIWSIVYLVRQFVVSRKLNRVSAE